MPITVDQSVIQCTVSRAKKSEREDRATAEVQNSGQQQRSNYVWQAQEVQDVQAQDVQEVQAHGHAQGLQSMRETASVRRQQQPTNGPAEGNQARLRHPFGAQPPKSNTLEFVVTATGSVL